VRHHELAGVTLASVSKSANESDEKVRVGSNGIAPTCEWPLIKYGRSSNVQLTGRMTDRFILAVRNSKAIICVTNR
jgi:hypothetical protein